MNYLVYDLATGRVESELKIPVQEDLAPSVPDGCSVIPFLGGDHALHYVDVSLSPHSYVNKTPLSLLQDVTQITADDIDSAMIENIPAGVFVTWPITLSLPEGYPRTEEITDGELEFATIQPGTHKLIFEGVKYLPQEITIEAII